MFSQKCARYIAKEKGNSKKESHRAARRFEGFTSLDRRGPRHFSDFLETGTPHLTGVPDVGP